MTKEGPKPESVQPSPELTPRQREMAIWQDRANHFLDPRRDEKRIKQAQELLKSRGIVPEGGRYPNDPSELNEMTEAFVAQGLISEEFFDAPKRVFSKALVTSSVSQESGVRSFVVKENTKVPPQPGIFTFEQLIDVASRESQLLACEEYAREFTARFQRYFDLPGSNEKDSKIVETRIRWLLLPSHELPLKRDKEGLLQMPSGSILDPSLLLDCIKPAVRETKLLVFSRNFSFALRRRLGSSREDRFAVPLEASLRKLFSLKKFERFFGELDDIRVVGTLGNFFRDALLFSRLSRLKGDFGAIWTYQPTVEQFIAEGFPPPSPRLNYQAYAQLPNPFDPACALFAQGAFLGRYELQPEELVIVTPTL